MEYQIEKVKTLPFISQMRDDPANEFDVALWQCGENICECREAGPCHAELGIFIGTSDRIEPKFCPRHYHEMHFGPAASYQLAQRTEVRRSSGGDHTPGPRNSTSVRIANNAERVALAEWLMNQGYEVADARGIAQAAKIAAFDGYITGAVRSEKGALAVIWDGYPMAFDVFAWDDQDKLVEYGPKYCGVEIPNQRPDKAIRW